MATSYTYSNTTNTLDSNTIGMLVVIYVVVLILYVLPVVITTWQLYKKAGKHGWATIVPIYNQVVELQIAKMPTWYVVLLFVPLVNIVIAIMALVNFTKQYDRKLGFWLAYIFLPIVAVFSVGKTQYTGTDGAVAATPAPSVDTGAIASSPAESNPESVSEDVASEQPIETVSEATPAEEPVSQPLVIPVGPAEDKPADAPVVVDTPVESAPETVTPFVEKESVMETPTVFEQPATGTPSAEPAAEEPVTQGLNMPSEPVVSPELEQQPAQEEQKPADSSQQPSATPPQQPLQ